MVSCLRLFVSNNVCLHYSVLTTTSEDASQSEEANVDSVRICNRVPGAVNKYRALEIQKLPVRER